MEKITGGKVIDLNRARPNPIFNGSFRQRIEDGIKPQTEKPEEVVQTVENLICAEIVLIMRAFFTRIAAKAGNSLGDKIGRKIG